MDRFSEDDRVACVVEGVLGTVVAAQHMIHNGTYQRVYLVLWDGATEPQLERAVALRAPTPEELERQ